MLLKGQPKRLFTRILIHAISWICYVLFKTYLNHDWLAIKFPRAAPEEIFSKGLQVQLSYLIVKIPLVYTLFYIVDKSLANHWSYKKLFITSLSVFFTGIMGLLIVDHLLAEELILKIHSAFTIQWMSVVYSFFVLSFCCGLALAVKLIYVALKQKETEHEVIKQKLETELRFLKAQTNPHFLFNTLNNIYALARKKSDDTADVVMKLSSLLRFMLYEAEKSIIPIGDELKMIESYTELEKLRHKPDKLSLTSNISVDDNNQSIAPLILLPFVENAFKHGAGESRFNSFISINTTLKKGVLDFIVENSKPEENSMNTEEKIGLNNVRRQLELLYPGHSLIITNDTSVFKIHLNIDLNKHAAI